MRKKVIIILIIIIISFTLGYLTIYIKNKNIISEGAKFKIEYESLNNVKDDKSNNEYLNINIDSNNDVKYASIDKILDILNGKNNETAIIYFGKSDCPWCRNMIVTLLQVAKENDIKKIYYYNPEEIRKENTEQYQELVSFLKDYLRTDTTTQKETDQNFDSSKKRLYMPDVYFIKNGKIIGNHICTVDSQTNPKIELTDTQKQELKEIYNNFIKQMKSTSTCDEGKGPC